VDVTIVAARLLLAAIFLLAGSTKLVDPAGSRKALRDFGLPSALASPMVLLLPLLEILVAVALIPNETAWFGACGALGLLALFVIAVTVAMVRGRKPDCHCFGQLHSEPVGWQTLFRNAVLAAVAGVVVASGRHFAGPEPWAWVGSLEGIAFKVVMIAAFAAAFAFLWAVCRARPKKAPVEQEIEAVELEETEEAPVERVAVSAPRPRPAVVPVTIEPEAVTRAPGPLDIGLPIGTPAPDFELPGITGERRSLKSLLAGGKDLVLIFTSPYCKSCEVVAGNLTRWKYEMSGLPNLILISRGTAKENLNKLKGFEASSILLQDKSEVAAAYDCSATPTAVLVGADGLIASLLVSGGMAIRELLASSVKRGMPEPVKSKAAQRASVFGN
jgi:peroxiredoxin